MAAKSDPLRKAREAKSDEFYTQLSDIENELRHYRAFFKGKTVFCNCDDPFESNFFKYFALNFNNLGLKKLITVSYAGSPVAGAEFSQMYLDGREQKLNPQKAYKVVMTELKDVGGDGREDLTDVRELVKHRIRTMRDDGEYTAGDFRSAESVNLLQQADIVCTNPPFSLFREYVAQLMQYGKKFIIIGNQNAIAYKEIFPLLKDNKIWLGYHFGDMAFKVPPYYEPRETRYWQDETGQKWRSLGTICWFTNLDIQKRHEVLDLYKNYTPEEYPRYSNFDAINVGKVADIPIDYDGIMGVPLTFLDKFNPEQFEIIGLGSGYLGQSIGITGIPKEHKKLMKGHSAAGDLYMMIDGRPQVPYSRVLIRRKVQ